MARFYDWFYQLSVWLILVTALLEAVPQEEHRSYIRFFTGLVLLTLFVAFVCKSGDILERAGEWEKAICTEMERLQEILEKQRKSEWESMGEEGSISNAKSFANRKV